MRLAAAGLGRISRYHRAALRFCPSIELTSAFDRNATTLSQLPSYIRRAASFDDLLMDDDVDAVLIATPTPTHEDLALRAIEARKPILIEKPVTLSSNSFERLRDAACSGEVPVFALFHAAYGFEVAAARTVVGAACDSTIAWHSAFHDPYESDPDARATLVNSWIDSGINALSVVQTVLGRAPLSLAFSSHTPAGAIWATACSVQTFELQPPWSGLVTLECNWRARASRKSTRLVLSSGQRLVLDHTEEALLQAASDDKGFVTTNYRNRRPRLVNQYVRAFADALATVEAGHSNWEFSAACHHPYFSAFEEER